MTLRRRNQLRFPLTKEGLVGLSQEIDALYRQIQDIDTALRSAASLTEGVLSPDVMPGLTGDVTAPAGSIATTLAATGVAAGSYGDASNVPQLTIDAKGRITGALNVAVSGGGSSTVTVSVYRATNQTLTHNTEAAITFSDEDYDAAGMWAIGTPTKLIIPASQNGVYTFLGGVKFGTGFAGVVHLRIYKNGVLLTEQTYPGSDVASGSEYHTVSVSDDGVATDYYELKVVAVLTAGSGTIDAVAGSKATFFQAVKASPQASGAGTAGNGISISGGVVSAKLDGTSLSVSASGLKVTAPSAWVQLAQIITAGTPTTVDFTSIPAGYNALVLHGIAQDTQAGNGGVQLRVKINGDAVAANYTNSGRIGSQNSSAFASGVAPSVKGAALGSSPQAGNTNNVAQNILTILGYAGTTFHKRLRMDTDYDEITLALTIYAQTVRWKSTAAINQITIGTDGTAFANGLVWTLYGVL